MTMIKHTIGLLIIGVTFASPWEPNYIRWVLETDGQHELKTAAGIVYALAFAYYGWVCTRVEVFQAYRKLPHALIGMALSVIWGTAIWLMSNGLIPLSFDVFYLLGLLSLAVAVSIEVLMHAEARQGPGAAKIKGRVARAHQPEGSIR